MSKRNVAFIKPKEPSFLAKLKQEAGYQEGPTVDTKREELPTIQDGDDFEDRDEDQPTVVVLKDGDLTAEEAADVKNHLAKEKADAPADLNEPIKFRKPVKSAAATSSIDEPPQKMKKPSAANNKLLSFDLDEDEE